jgi:hypothetical protein
MEFFPRETTKTYLPRPPYLLILNPQFAMGGRTAIDFEPYKDQMITWFQDENKTIDEIVELLHSSYNKTIASQTIKRRLQDWGITKRTRAENTAALRARIAYMFCTLWIYR